MACPSDLGSPSERAALAAVRIAVDGLDGGEHGGRSRGRPTAPRRGRGPRAGAFIHYPASIGLIQARAIHAFFDGDLDTAKAASSDGARLSREAGDLYYLVQMLMYLGQAAMLAGDVAASKPRFVDALRIARQIDDRLTQYDLLSLLGWHAAMSGHPRLAAQLLGAAEAVGSGAGAGMAGPAMPLLARANEAAVERAGGIEVRGRVRGRQAHGPGSGTAPCAERIRGRSMPTPPIRLRPDHWRSGRSRWRDWSPKA